MQHNTQHTKYTVDKVKSHSAIIQTNEVKNRPYSQQQSIRLRL